MIPAERRDLEFQRRILVSHLGKLVRMRGKDRVILTGDITVIDEIRRVNQRLQDIKTRLSFTIHED